MKSRPVTPKIHGIIDYVFAATLLVGPPLLQLNEKARRLYQFLAGEILLYSALTDYPAGIKHIIAYQTHHKIDLANIIGFAAETAAKEITEDKQTLAFHTGITILAIMVVLLTDWKGDGIKK